MFSFRFLFGKAALLHLPILKPCGDPSSRDLQNPGAWLTAAPSWSISYCGGSPLFSHQQVSANREALIELVKTAEAIQAPALKAPR